MQSRKRLFIVGAGNMGRELESWLSLIPSEKSGWEIIGFLSDVPDALTGFPSEFKILGTINDYPLQQEDYLLLAISDPKDKKEVYKRLEGRARMFSFIYPDVIIGKYTRIGKGCIILPGSIISNNVTLGDFITINCGTQIGHDCVIGQFSSLMSNADLGGKCILGEGVFMGTNSTCLPEKTIAPNTYVGSGAIVVRNINSPGTYFGNPAKLLK